MTRSVERLDGGIALHGRESGHPQVTAHQVIAAFAHDVTVRFARLSVAIDAAAHFHG